MYAVASDPFPRRTLRFRSQKIYHMKLPQLMISKKKRREKSFLISLEASSGYLAVRMIDLNSSEI